MKLASCLINEGVLLQHVSHVDYRDTPLHFGRDGNNRYDAPNRDYGVLYLGRDLPTALMESVFHKHKWNEDAQRHIAWDDVLSRLVRGVGVLKELELADFTAHGVMAGQFGLNLEQLVSRDYTHTQLASGRTHAAVGGDGRLLFDGILYPSRNNYPGTSIALFERAHAKVKVVRDISLSEHGSWGRFVEEYRIGVVMPDSEF